MIESMMLCRIEDSLATAILSWNPADPYAVEVNYVGHSVWTFAVDLLRNGGGIGDVTVYTVDGDTHIVLNSEFVCDTVFTAQEIADFVKHIPTIPAATLPTDAEIEEFINGYYDYS